MMTEVPKVQEGEVWGRYLHLLADWRAKQEHKQAVMDRCRENAEEVQAAGVEASEVQRRLVVLVMSVVGEEGRMGKQVALMRVKVCMERMEELKLWMGRLEREAVAIARDIRQLAAKMEVVAIKLTEVQEIVTSEGKDSSEMW